MLVLVEFAAQESLYELFVLEYKEGDTIFDIRERLKQRLQVKDDFGRSAWDDFDCIDEQLEAVNEAFVLEDTLMKNLTTFRHEELDILDEDRSMVHNNTVLQIVENFNPIVIKEEDD